MWWAVIASTRSRGQGAHGWHEAAQSHPQAVISLVGYHTRAGKQSLQTKNNALSREYQCQSTTVCQACHPGHRCWNALLRCLQVLRWSAFGFFLQGCTLRCEQEAYGRASDWFAGVAKLLLPRRSRQLSLQQTLCGSVKYYSQQWSAMSTEKAREHVRILKWVLLVTVPRTVLDATASVLTRLGNAAAQLVLRTQPRRAALRTASVRQDHRQYCVLVLRTHPVGSVVLRTFNSHPHYLLERTQNMLERWDGTSDTEVSSSGRRGEHEHRS